MSTPFARIVSVALAALGACRAGEPPAPANVLVVTLDTFRADSMPGFGGAAAELPNFAAWIGEGTRYTRAYTTAPITVPAHTSLWTGELPARHGVRSQAPNPEHQARYHLLEALGQAGYVRGGFVAAVVLGRGITALHRAFDHYDEPHEVYERSAARIVDAAEQWLAEVPAGKPVALWLHFFEPHMPYLPSAPRWRECAEHDRDRALEWVKNIGHAVVRLPPETSWLIPCLRDLYRGELAELDAVVPRVRALTQARGRWVWALMADHGECLGEEGQIARHANSVLECALSIPLALGGDARLAKGRVDERLASITDVAPTLAALLGLPLFAGNGVSLLAPADPTRALFFEAAGVPVPGLAQPAAGAWRGDAKVVYAYGERRRRAWRRVDGKVTEIDAAAVGGRAADLLDWLAVQPPPPAGEAQPVIAPRTEEALRALGYTE